MVRKERRPKGLLVLDVGGRPGGEQAGEELGLGVDPKAAVDGGQVVAHRALAEEQLPGDRGHALAAQQAAQDLQLALGQLAQGGIAPQRTGTQTASEPSAEPSADPSEGPTGRDVDSDRTRTMVVTARRSTPERPRASRRRGASSGCTTDCSAVPRYASRFQPNHVVASGLNSLKRHSWSTAPRTRRKPPGPDVSGWHGEPSGGWAPAGTSATRARPPGMDRTQPDTGSSPSSR